MKKSMGAGFVVEGGEGDKDYRYEEGTLTILSNADITISGTVSEQISVNSEEGANLTLNNLHIDCSNAPAIRIVEGTGALNIRYLGKNTLKGRGYACIFAEGSDGVKRAVDLVGQGADSELAVQGGDNGVIGILGVVSASGEGSLSITGGYGARGVSIASCHPGGAGVEGSLFITDRIAVNVTGGHGGAGYSGGGAGDRPGGSGGAAVNGSVTIENNTAGIRLSGGHGSASGGTAGGGGGQGVTGELKIVNAENIKITGGDRGGEAPDKHNSGAAGVAGKMTVTNGSLRVSSGASANGGGRERAYYNLGSCDSALICANGECMIIGELRQDETIEEGEAFRIDTEITIPADITLTNNGSIFITETGMLKNYGTITDNGTITNIERLKNYGILNGSSTESTGTGNFIVTGGELKKDYRYIYNTLTILRNTALTISGTGTEPVSIDSADGANLTFSDLHIDCSDAPAIRIVEGTGALNIRYSGKNTLKGRGYACIFAEGSDGVKRAVNLVGQGADAELAVQGDDNGVIGIHGAVLASGEGSLSITGGYGARGVSIASCHPGGAGVEGSLFITDRIAVNVTGGHGGAGYSGGGAGDRPGGSGGAAVNGSVTIENNTAGIRLSGGHGSASGGTAGGGGGQGVTGELKIVNAENIKITGGDRGGEAPDKHNSGAAGVAGKMTVANGSLRVSSGASANGGGRERAYYNLGSCDNALICTNGVWEIIGQLCRDVTIESGESLIIDSEFIICEDVTLVNNGNILITEPGKLTNKGTIRNGGVVTNNGMITNKGLVTNKGTINGSGACYTPVGDLTLQGYIWNEDYIYERNTLKILTGMPITILGTSSRDRLAVAAGVAANITLEDININCDTGAFEVMESAVCNLTLIGKNTLNSGYGHAGLNVPEGAELVISKDSKGALLVSSEACAAGIGGNDNQGAGSITIDGGIITAKASASYGDPAGIGAGGYGNAGIIRITGGSVCAEGSQKGIGSGSHHTGGSIEITGGFVTSQGIGTGGYNSSVTTKILDSAFVVCPYTEFGGINKENQADWNGIIFEGNDGKIYGTEVTLVTDVVIETGMTLMIDSDKTLIIGSGVTLTNNGTIIKHGKIINNGIINGNGTVTDVSGLRMEGILPGAYTRFRLVNEDDVNQFREALLGIVGSDFEPLLVAALPTAHNGGSVYICNVTTVAINSCKYVAAVKIFDGRVVSIQKIDLGI